MYNIEIFQQFYKCEINQVESKFVAETVEIMKLDHHDFEFAERFGCAIENYAKFIAFDIHLKDKVAVMGRIVFYPAVESLCR